MPVYSSQKSLLFLFVFLVFGYVHILADCLPDRNYQDLQYWQADLVIIGKVEKIDFGISDNNITKPIPPNKVKFNIEKFYRGKIKESVQTIEISAYSYLEMGKSYFIYAYLVKDSDSYTLYDGGECGILPLLLENAKDDIEYAEDIAQGKSGTLIYGFVYQDKQESYRKPRQMLPLFDIEVSIKSKKHFFTTKTDSNGKYIFRNIPEGEYIVEAGKPEGLRKRDFASFREYESRNPNTLVIGKTYSLDSFIISGKKLKPKKYFRRWDSYSFYFTNLSSIEGKITDFAGNLPIQQFISLVPITDIGKTLLDSPIQSLWADKESGKFIFDGVPKGQYKIVINPYNCQQSRNPEFGIDFFPGVKSLADAETISIDENQKIRIKDFRLLPPLKERWFSGVVLSADKKPLANARIMLMNKDTKHLTECFFSKTDLTADEFGRFKVKAFESYEYVLRAITETKNLNQTITQLYSKPFNISSSQENLENIELIVDSIYW